MLDLGKAFVWEPIAACFQSFKLSSLKSDYTQLQNDIEIHISYILNFILAFCKLQPDEIQTRERIKSQPFEKEGKEKNQNKKAKKNLI